MWCGVVCGVCSYLENELLKKGANKFIAGSHLTIADLYATIALTWTKLTGVDLTPYPAVAAYFKAMQATDVWQNGQKVIATKPAAL